MNERVPLSFLLTLKKDEEPPVEPVVPFAAVYGEAPKIVTAVLERTAVLAEPSDRYERVSVRHELVLVDPAVIEWRTRTATYEGSRLNGAARERKHISNSPWRVEMATTYEAAKDGRTNAQQREVSDARALKNRADIARQLELERERDHSVPFTQTTKETPMPEVLKRCPACKLEKPKEAFPAGQGFAMCNECRTSREAAPAPTSPRVGRIVKPAEGMKFCPHCKAEKPLDAFSLNARKADGRQSVCRDCRSNVWSAGAAAMGHQRAAKAGNPAAQLKVVIDGLRRLIGDLRVENERLKADLASITSQLEDLMTPAV